MKSTRLPSVLLALLSCLRLDAAQVAPEELAARDSWVQARFDAPAATPAAQPAIVVLAVEGAVLKNERAGKPLTIAGRAGAHGLCAHASSVLLVILPGPGAELTALAGIDSNEQTSGGRGSVVFSVRVGDVEKFRSGVLREGMAGAPVKVDLAGATRFVLGADPTPDGIACDHADWLEAKATLADGRELKLADLPVRAATAADVPPPGPPFSFTYGGKASSELLSAWKLERSERTLDPACRERTSTWTDPATGLVVRCVALQYAAFPTVEWKLTFKNTGARATPIIADLNALDATLERPDGGEYLLRHLTGDDCSARSYEPHATVLQPGSRLRFAPEGGRPTAGAFPYFNVERPGGGVIAAIGWPGQWAAEFTRDAGRGLRMRGGQELTHFALLPGEAVRTPFVVLQFWEGGDWIRAQNVWRRWMVACNLPRPGGELVPTHYASCFGNELPRAAVEIEQIEGWFAQQIPLDYWFIDTGWFIHEGPWWNTGTWEIDRTRFPKGLKEVADAVHAHGGKFIVWFEPERLAAGSWLAENHPEWILKDGPAWLVDLGNRDAWKWVVERIDGFLTSEEIDVYRQDFNMSPLPCWRGADAPDRQGVTEIRHVEGYLGFFDELLRRHPKLLIDTCASGGRRNDLETLRRAVPLLRSDYPLIGTSPSIADGQQCQTMGLSLWVPHHGTGLGFADVYAMRSAFAPAYRIGCDMHEPKIDLAQLRRTVDEFRKTQEFWLGDFYPLTGWSLAEDIWLAWQFDRPETGAGFVQAFRRAQSPYETARFPLRGLDASSVYEVTNADAPAAPARIEGRELLERGLSVTLRERRSSALLFYRHASGDRR